MPPAWTDVVSAVALAVVAVAAVGGAAAAVVLVRELRRFFATVERLAGPAVSDARQLVAAIRTEAEALVGTSRDIRGRIMRAADAAEARLADLDALFEVVQDEVEDTALDVTAALRDVRRGTRVWQWVRGLLEAPRRPRKRRRR